MYFSSALFGYARHKTKEMDPATAEEASSRSNALTSYSFIQQQNSLLDVASECLVARVPAITLMGHLDKGKKNSSVVASGLASELGVVATRFGRDLGVQMRPIVRWGRGWLAQALLGYGEH